MKKKHALPVLRSENYANWYQEAIKGADLAETTDVRGCMVIKPWGNALWEGIKNQLNNEIEATGHENIYCPLFIPLDYLEKESSHVEGFAKECAVVTHRRLEKNAEGKLVPAAPLEKPLIVRPTSETIIGELFAKWISSYRDLPLLINQWANVVRWEMRTRLFLRTTEFLWQEGHTAHQTSEQANTHALKMLNMYQTFCHEYLAMPVIAGQKSLNEKFPGAEITYTCEAIMQDQKALQIATSHHLGSNFAKASDIKFQDKDGEVKRPTTTSWGTTTRLIGALVNVHGDDDGIILPPKIAPKQVVIVTFINKNSDIEKINHGAEQLKNKLEEKNIRVKVDTSDHNGSHKRWHWIKKGVPIIISIGQKEIDLEEVSITLRTSLETKPETQKQKDFIENIDHILSSMQQKLFEKALANTYGQIKLLHSVDAIYEHFKSDVSPVCVYWTDHDDLEESLQKELQISLRVYPHHNEHILYQDKGICVHDAEQQGQLVILAKAY